MKRLFVVLLVATFCALPSLAQDKPKAELFAGYAFTRINPGQGVSGENGHGWAASIAGNVNDWFGVVGEFSGAYPNVAGLDANVHLYTFGPRFSYRKNEKVTPFAHVTFGGARVSGSGLSENAFAMTFGGGVDVKCGERVAVRVAQFDYILTRFDGPVTGTAANQHNFRYAAGIVFRF